MTFSHGLFFAPEFQERLAIRRSSCYNSGSQLCKILVFCKETRQNTYFAYIEQGGDEEDGGAAGSGGGAPDQVPASGGAFGLRLTPDDLEAYLDDLSRRGRVSGTLETYRRNIHALYEDLPEDKLVRPGTLRQWQRELLEGGYSPRTVNARISAANGLVSFLGRRGSAVCGCSGGRGCAAGADADGVPPPAHHSPALDKERLYLLVKLFGCTGIPVQELPQVTVEALKRAGSPSETAGPSNCSTFGLFAEGITGLRPAGGDRFRSRFPHQERETAGPYRGDGQHQAAVP